MPITREEIYPGMSFKELKLIIVALKQSASLLPDTKTAFALIHKLNKCLKS